VGVYFIANIRIRDETVYAKYLAECDEVFARFGGKYVAVDDAPVVLEGSWDYTKTVVIHFRSRADFEAWYRAPDYEEIKQFRLAGADCDTILVRDKEPELVLERAGPEDPEVRELIELLDGALRARYPDPTGVYAAKNRLAPDVRIVLLRADGKAVACGALRPFSEGTFEVKRMFVRDACRGKGYSRLVLDGLEKWARELGGRRLVLETGLGQTEALGLYRKSGFVRIDNYGEYAGMENSVCMEKSI